MEYLSQYRAVCAHPGPSSVGPGNQAYMQIKDAVRQAVKARDSCCLSPQECDALMMERIYNSDPPPRA